MKRFNIVTILLISFLMISGSAIGSSFDAQTAEYNEKQTETSDVNLTNKQKVESICQKFVVYSANVYDARQQGVSLDRVLSNLDSNVGDDLGRSSFMFQFLKKAAIGIYRDVRHLSKDDLLRGYYVGCYSEMSKRLE